MVKYGGNRLEGFDPFSCYTRETLITAALLCLYGFVNLIPGVYDLVLNTTDGQSWDGDTDTYPPVVLLLAALIQIIFSVVAMIVGFQWFVSGAGSSKVSFLSLVTSLFSLFTLAVGISYISFLIDKLDKVGDGFTFIPHQYTDPSKQEKRSVGSLLLLGYIAYAANNFIAIVHFNCKLFMFQSDKGSTVTRALYQKLYALQGFLTLLAGTVQLALGAYIYDKVDEEELDYGILMDGYLGGPYAIKYSEVAMAVGAFQIVLGFFIFFRAFQKPGDQNAKMLQIFQAYAWFVLLFSIAAQVLAQLAMFNDGDRRPATTSGYAVQAVALVVGLGLFPIYLDVMYYTTPETIAEGTFSCNAPWIKEEDLTSAERKVESGLKPEEGVEKKAVEGGDTKPAEAAV